MKTIIHLLFRRISVVAGIAALLCVAENSRAYGQFTAVIGDGTDNVAQGGVVIAADGNFVSVGYTNGGTKAGSDVYVVKTNLCGARIWGYYYNFGGNDVGRKIRLTRDNGFIIAGSVDNGNAGGADGLLMKIDANGSMEWAKTYGGYRSDDFNDVKMLPNGEGYYVAGRSASFGAGGYDGWLLLASIGGDVLSSKVYGAAKDDEFNSLDFACDGTILAAGSSRSYVLDWDGNGDDIYRDQDIYVVKIGSGVGAVSWASIYGGAGEEVAYSIISDGVPGDAFYLAGFTTTGGTDGQGYVMQGQCSTGKLAIDKAYGARWTQGMDEFREIQMLPTGNLILTGIIEQSPYLIDSLDMHLMEITPNLDLVWNKGYGGRRDDAGWSVAVVPERETPRYGLVQVGYTTSFNGVDLYQVYTTSTGYAGCKEFLVELEERDPVIGRVSVTTNDPTVIVQREALAVTDAVTVSTVLCNSCDPPDDKENPPGLSERIERDGDMLDHFTGISPASR